MATFGSNFIIVPKTWAGLKDVVSSKALSLQYDTLSDSYQLFGIDQQMLYVASIYLGILPDSISGSYSQVQNDLDKADFETNYKPVSNKPLDMRTVVGTPSSGSGLIGFYGAYVSTAAASNVAVRASTFIEQTSIASRSFSSTNAADNASGSGTRQIRLTYYDNSMNGPFTEDLFLSGTTNVNTRAGNIRFVESVKSLLTGSNGGNLGNINMFATTAGGGGMIAQILAGDSKTYYAHHYIRPNVTFYLEKLLISSTAVSGNIAIRYVNPLIVNSFEDQIGTMFRATPTAQPATYDFDDTVQVQGPARITFYVRPDGAGASGYFVNFGWEEY